MKDDVASLDEVVVVGYGTQACGSITSHFYQYRTKNCCESSDNEYPVT
ncbi:hypothetical protein NXW14_23945 [Bacteroides thetaiotaomicron]|nr:hypothetical protein [Bacteroides thetaiotaomicron]MCS2191286.1 hypothetical protein [Bacteroides thetaiotaomicron]